MVLMTIVFLRMVVLHTSGPVAGPPAAAAAAAAASTAADASHSRLDRTRACPYTTGIALLLAYVVTSLLRLLLLPPLLLMLRTRDSTEPELALTLLA